MTVAQLMNTPQVKDALERYRQMQASVQAAQVLLARPEIQHLLSPGLNERQAQAAFALLEEVPPAALATQVPLGALVPDVPFRRTP